MAFYKRAALRQRNITIPSAQTFYAPFWYPHGEIRQHREIPFCSVLLFKHCLENLISVFKTALPKGLQRNSGLSVLLKIRTGLENWSDTFILENDPAASNLESKIWALRSLGVKLERKTQESQKFFIQPQDHYFHRKRKEVHCLS